VKEKVLGALRAGIATIVLPKENVADLDDLGEAERDRLTVHEVAHLSEVLRVALQPPVEADPAPAGRQGDRGVAAAVS
jgi:ATP-dependent Lon protease